MAPLLGSLSVRVNFWGPGPVTTKSRRIGTLTGFVISPGAEDQRGRRGSVVDPALRRAVGGHEVDRDVAGQVEAAAQDVDRHEAGALEDRVGALVEPEGAGLLVVVDGQDGRAHRAELGAAGGSAEGEPDAAGAVQSGVVEDRHVEGFARHVGGERESARDRGEVGAGLGGVRRGGVGHGGRRGQRAGAQHGDDRAGRALLHAECRGAELEGRLVVHDGDGGDLPHGGQRQRPDPILAFESTTVKVSLPSACVS